ncbi:hypothetical protein VZT92_027033 [Zoarces viviparus]|uniref:Uncharacterized protein n=1 Tax=Zoarces viviparus TaxID=48416 RepID=A0AAW1DV36_ZOAVI
MCSVSLHKTTSQPKVTGRTGYCISDPPRPSTWKCGSGEVWEITTLILFKTHGLINTGGILTGSRPRMYRGIGVPRCIVYYPQDPWLRSYSH